MDSSREAKAVDYRIKGEQRAKRLAKAKSGMRVDNRSIFTIVRTIAKKAKAAK